ncbi:MAG TPA: recombinase RecT [Gemmatimonadales bacterium]|nr:recombinase RecT [Gemmatimonadales bacterium]
MTAAVQHQPQAVTTQEPKRSLLDTILESTKTQDRIVPFLKNGASDYDRVAAAVRLYAQMHPEILGCTPASVQAAIIKVAQWGLEIGETAHLVPFNVNVAPKGQSAKWEKHLTPIADYKGLIQLMIAATTVRHIEPPRIVYSNETFKQAYGSDRTLYHEPIDDRAVRGKIKGVYVVFWLRFGIRDWLYMPFEDIEDIRKQYSKQWKDGELKPWYAKKTVIRQLAKYLPKDPRLASVLAVVREDEREELGQELDEVIAETHRRRANDEDEIVPPAPPATTDAPPTEMGEEWQDDRALAD